MDRPDTRHLASRFKALSEPLRLEILALLLRHGDLCVCEVERLLDVPQSTASRHLRYLLNAGLVQDRREGLWMHYRIVEPLDDDGRRFLAYLETLLSGISGEADGSLAAARGARLDSSSSSVSSTSCGSRPR